MNNSNDLIEPPWINNYMKNLTNKLWIPNNLNSNYQNKYKFETHNKNIKFESKTNNLTKFTSFNYKQIDKYPILTRLNKLVIEHEKINKQISKDQNLIYLCLFNNLMINNKF